MVRSSRVLLVTLLLMPPSSGSALAQHWPSFRGVNAAGVAEAGAPPVTWDVSGRQNVVWTTEIPGFGHSSPVVWGDRIFVTTAVPLRPTGGSGTGGAAVNSDEYRAIEVQTPHAWRLYCLDRARAASSGNGRHTRARHG
jgi:hypothetical protein